MARQWYCVFCTRAGRVRQVMPAGHGAILTSVVTAAADVAFRMPDLRVRSSWYPP